LFFGVEAEPPAPDFGGLVSHFEDAIARREMTSATLRAFVGRIGSAIADEIETIANHLLVENDRMLGAGLTASEVRVIERISKRIRIATVDLTDDVVLLPDKRVDSAAQSDDPGDHPDVIPAPFTAVISDNVRQGSEYVYVIPEGREWRAAARDLREAICHVHGVTSAAADRRIRFYQSSRSLAPGYVIYTLDFSRAATKEERLLDQIGDFVDKQTCLVALAEPTNRQSQFFSLIDPRHHQRMVEDHDALARTCRPVDFRLM
jgi:hypothetical protein